MKIKKLAGALIACGFLIILVTAMASDSSQSLPFLTIITRGAIGLALVGTGFFILDESERNEER